MTWMSKSQKSSSYVQFFLQRIFSMLLCFENWNRNSLVSVQKSHRNIFQFYDRVEHRLWQSVLCCILLENYLKPTLICESSYDWTMLFVAYVPKYFIQNMIRDVLVSLPIKYDKLSLMKVIHIFGGWVQQRYFFSHTPRSFMWSTLLAYTWQTFIQ